MGQNKSFARIFLLWFGLVRFKCECEYECEFIVHFIFKSNLFNCLNATTEKKNRVVRSSEKGFNLHKKISKQKTKRFSWWLKHVHNAFILKIFLLIFCFVYFYLFFFFPPSQEKKNKKKTFKSIVLVICFNYKSAGDFSYSFSCSSFRAELHQAVSWRITGKKGSKTFILCTRFVKRNTKPCIQNGPGSTIHIHWIDVYYL